MNSRYFNSATNFAYLLLKFKQMALHTFRQLPINVFKCHCRLLGVYLYKQATSAAGTTLFQYSPLPCCYFSSKNQRLAHKNSHHGGRGGETTWKYARPVNLSILDIFVASAFMFFMRSVNNRAWKQNQNINKHTHMRTYLYMCMCMVESLDY